jgi:hypothetical protein
MPTARRRGSMPSADAATAGTSSTAPRTTSPASSRAFSAAILNLRCVSPIGPTPKREAVPIVGTHARRIEADLLDFFAALGWKLEDEGVCGQVQTAGGFRLVRDGYQVWVNPRRDLLR